MPIRAEFIEGTGIVPPQPEHRHNAGIVKLIVQFHLAGFDLAGVNDGFRVTQADGTTMALVVPDFYVCRREPTELDESYRKAHRGWYPIDLLALVGEVTSTNHEMDTGPKLRAYAAAGIPVYVLIDRHAKTAHCYTDPVAPRRPTRPTRATRATTTPPRRTTAPTPRSPSATRCPSRRRTPLWTPPLPQELKSTTLAAPGDDNVASGPLSSDAY
ncbi:Uma2 family endonuclease [Streptomyces nogalater]